MTGAETGVDVCSADPAWTAAAETVEAAAETVRIGRTTGNGGNHDRSRAAENDLVCHTRYSR
jgi:succinylarginine dihydrolase